MLGHSQPRGATGSCLEPDFKRRGGLGALVAAWLLAGFTSSSGGCRTLTPPMEAVEWEHWTGLASFSFSPCWGGGGGAVVYSVFYEIFLKLEVLEQVLGVKSFL